MAMLSQFPSHQLMDTSSITGGNRNPSDNFNRNAVDQRMQESNYDEQSSRKKCTLSIDLHDIKELKGHKVSPKTLSQLLRMSTIPTLILS